VDDTFRREREGTLRSETWFKRLGFVVRSALAYHAMYDRPLVQNDPKAASLMSIQAPVIKAIQRHPQRTRLQTPTEQIEDMPPATSAGTPSEDLLTISSERPSVEAEPANQYGNRRIRLGDQTRAKPALMSDVRSKNETNLHMLTHLFTSKIVYAGRITIHRSHHPL
jgi:hypothetical protein